MGVDAEDTGRHDLMQERLDRGRGHEGFAQTVKPIVAVHAHPQDIGELEQPDRLQLGDFHDGAPVACSSSMRASSMISSMACSAASASRALIASSTRSCMASPSDIGMSERRWRRKLTSSTAETMAPSRSTNGLPEAANTAR